MIVRELLTRLGFTVDEGGAKQYENRMSNIQRHAATLQRNLGGLLGTLGLGMSFAFFNDVTSAFTDLESRLANQLGLEDVTEQMRALNEVALLTYQPVEQVIEGFLSMKSGLDVLGLSVEEQVGLQQSIADGFTATGVKGEAASRAMMWLNRAFMKGNVSAEELNGLFESSDDLMQQFAQDLLGPEGTIVGLNEMAKSGNLTSEMMVDFYQRHAPRFREESEKMPVTINDSIARIVGSFRWFVYEQDKAFGLSYKIAQVLLVVADNVEILAGVIALLLIPAMMGIVVWIASTTAAFAGLTLALLASPWTWVALAIAGVVLAIQDLYTWITGGDSYFGRWFGSWDDAVEAMTASWNNFVQPFKDFWASIQDLMAASSMGEAWQAICDAMEAAWGILWNISILGTIEAIAPTLFDPLKEWFTNALTWITEKWTAFWGGLKSGLGSLLSGEAFGEMGGSAGSNLMGGDSALGRAGRWARDKLGFGGEGGASLGPTSAPAEGGASGPGNNVTSNVTNHINVTTSARDPEEVARLVDDRLRRAARDTEANFARTA